MNHADLTAAGFDLVRPLGSGGSGEVWLARELATGDPVALKRLRPSARGGGSDPGLAALRREAAVLGGLQHPHLIRLRDVVDTADGAMLVLDYAAGGSLSDLLAARGRLTAGEVVTTAAPIAQALATAHASGVVHGDVSPANILFAADGRPLLADLGVASLVGAPSGTVSGTPEYLDPGVLAGAAVSPATDIFGLAAVCHRALTGRSWPGDAGMAGDDAAPSRAAGSAATDEGLRSVLRSGLDPDPARRPSAAAFAVALFDSTQPSPVRLVRPPSRSGRSPAGGSELTRRVRRQAQLQQQSPPGRRRRGRQRCVAGNRGSRRLGTALIAAGVAGLLGLGALHLGGGRSGAAASDRPPPAGAASPRASLPVKVEVVPSDRGSGWRAVLNRLDLTRSTAFASGDETALGTVYASGAPAFDRDRALLRQLVSVGARARGLRLTISHVEPVVVDRERVVLRVSDELKPYSVVDVSGAELEKRPGRGQQSWEVTLSRERGSWRVFDIVRSPG